ncbi:hypothetical protein B9Z55_019002 [Caenorhabditis nigoni]|uniref:Glycosyl hydrolase family 31 C-terminal domain-containing protein n=1 Tax=Caenorhabditis nigoni TaxID=1611254 RepID=A0A2G5TGS8_9PELO|nr:hypothetical protein B9Z55_019002 [Caenorhabditis nigoni]
MFDLYSTSSYSYEFLFVTVLIFRVLNLCITTSVDNPVNFSLRFNAARYGHTVIRPLFFEYPEDEETLVLTLSEQFLWGSALMIAPALYQFIENHKRDEFKNAIGMRYTS